MSIERALRNAAAELVKAAERKASTLQRELERIEARKSEIEAELHSAHLAHKRLADFPITVSGGYQCPRCWIDGEAAAPLVAVASDAYDDILRCRTCGSEFSIPA